MRRSLLLLFFIVVPFQVFAAGLPSQVSNFMGKIYVEILNPIITVAYAIAIMYLSWSVFQYTLKSDKLDKEKLKNSLIYGVLGVFVMSMVFAIMKFVARSVTGTDTMIGENV